MGDMSTYIGVEPRTVQADPANAQIGRGLRVLYQANGFVALQDATARGDFVTLQAIAPGKAGAAASGWGGGKVPAVGTVATNPGDLAYTAAAGQFTNIATGAQLVGKWIQGCPGAGLLGEVELE